MPAQACDGAHWQFAQAYHAAEKCICLWPISNGCLQDYLGRGVHIAAMDFGEAILRQIFIDQVHGGILNRRAADRNLIHTQMRLAHAHRHPLSTLAAIAAAGIELHVVTDH